MKSKTKSDSKSDGTSKKSAVKPPPISKAPSFASFRKTGSLAFYNLCKIIIGFDVILNRRLMFIAGVLQYSNRGNCYTIFAYFCMD